MTLKTWDDRDWTKKITKTLTVGMVDDDQGVGETYKQWYLTLTQDPIRPLKGVRGIPPSGKTLLLHVDDVVAFARYLIEKELVEENESGLLVDARKADWDRWNNKLGPSIKRLIAVQFLDKNDLVIDTARLYRHTVAAFEERTITDSELISSASALRVTQAKAIVQRVAR